MNSKDESLINVLRIMNKEYMELFRLQEDNIQKLIKRIQLLEEKVSK